MRDFTGKAPGQVAYEERRTRAARDGVFLPPYERLSTAKKVAWANDHNVWCWEWRRRGGRLGWEKDVDRDTLHVITETAQ